MLNVWLFVDSLDGIMQFAHDLRISIVKIQTAIERVEHIFIIYSADQRHYDCIGRNRQAIANRLPFGIVHHDRIDDYNIRRRHFDFGFCAT